MKQRIEFELNGQRVAAEVSGGDTLLKVLREQFELTGVKEGCGEGECGACTVIVDGRTLTACIFPAMEVEGSSVLTVEGLAEPGGDLHPVQQAFIDNGAVQCGFCTPGNVLSAKALLDEKPQPSETEIRTALAGNLCRCTGYIQIIEAVKAAARRQP